MGHDMQSNVHVLYTFSIFAVFVLSAAVTFSIVKVGMEAKLWRQASGIRFIRQMQSVPRPLLALNQNV